MVDDAGERVDGALGGFLSHLHFLTVRSPCTIAARLENFLRFSDRTNSNLSRLRPAAKFDGLGLRCLGTLPSSRIGRALHKRNRGRHTPEKTWGRRLPAKGFLNRTRNSRGPEASPEEMTFQKATASPRRIFSIKSIASSTMFLSGEGVYLAKGINRAIRKATGWGVRTSDGPLFVWGLPEDKYFWRNATFGQQSLRRPFCLNPLPR